MGLGKRWAALRLKGDGLLWVVNCPRRWLVPAKSNQLQAIFRLGFA